MALQLLPPIDIGWVDSKRASTDANSGANAAVNYTTNFAELAGVASLRTALNTFDPITYTSAVLDIMSVNDMVFAWRQTSSLLNAQGIANYIPRQTART